LARALDSALTAAPERKKISRKGAKAQKIRSSTLLNVLSLRFGGFA
jgi:hypothetical protein